MHSPSFVAVKDWLNIAAIAMQFRPFERRLRSCQAVTPFGCSNSGKCAEFA
jgi:hypothetical protein